MHYKYLDFIREFFFFKQFKILNYQDELVKLAQVKLYIVNEEQIRL